MEVEVIIQLTKATISDRCAVCPRVTSVSWLAKFKIFESEVILRVNTVVTLIR